MRVKELLDLKGQTIDTISTDQTVEAAIHEMADRKTSLLVVVKNESPVGLFAERDVLRCYLMEPDKTFREIRVQDAMTKKMIVAEPDYELREAVDLMLKADIRHLPVMQGKTLLGLLTIKDLVARLMSSLTSEIDHLHDYISDLQEAGRD